MKYEVEVTRAGYLYYFGLGTPLVVREDGTEVPLGEEELVREDYLEGAYMHLFGLRRVYLNAGVRLRCQGYEGCLIAEDIEIVKNRS